jgi:mono/diheme cytochrome c family protein
MRSLLFLLSMPLFAQDPERGAQVFRITCAQGYCHGSGGTQGRAPKLIGRNFDGPLVAKVVSDGIANTGMPGFRQRLPGTQLDDVVAYVVKISGGDMSTLRATGGAAHASIPAAAVQGKALFFDALLSVDRCSTCHLLEGVGTAVGPNLASGGPHTASAIRQGKPGSVRLATLQSGEKFPALVVEQGDWVKLYDLGGNPPVLRTVAKGEASFSGGSTWSHAQATKRYSDTGLAAIAEYLNYIAKQ